jgi:mono/diheme cytochrome c family protein
MDKKILVPTILTVAIALFLTVYWLLEPQRLRIETERMRAEAAEQGEKLYMTHCKRCHGEHGGPQRGIRPINSKDYLKNVDDIILYKIIERGIPGTGMVALGEKEGGPLNSEEIRDLVAFIRDWEKTAPEYPEQTPAGDRPRFLHEEVAYVGSESCIGCHESLNKEYVETWRKSSMAQHAFDPVRGEEDQSRCLPCHAMGYDPEKKTYVEKNVGCEACHGPGERYQEMMMGAQAQQGGKIARENARKSCTRCHRPHIEKGKHVEMARKGLLPYP